VAAAPLVVPASESSSQPELEPATLTTDSSATLVDSASDTLDETSGAPS
jgi:hypothetical protein